MTFRALVLCQSSKRQVSKSFSSGNIFKILKFRKFQPQYSCTVYSYWTKRVYCKLKDVPRVSVKTWVDCWVNPNCGDFSIWHIFSFFALLAELLFYSLDTDTEKLAQSSETDTDRSTRVLSNSLSLSLSLPLSEVLSWNSLDKRMMPTELNYLNRIPPIQVLSDPLNKLIYRVFFCCLPLFCLHVQALHSFNRLHITTILNSPCFGFRQTLYKFALISSIRASILVFHCNDTRSG